MTLVKLQTAQEIVITMHIKCASRPGNKKNLRRKLRLAPPNSLGIRRTGGKKKYAIKQFQSNLWHQFLELAISKS